MLIFNIHDVVLLLTASQYVILSVLLLLVKKTPEKSLRFLIPFLLINACITLDLLFIWSNPIRQIMLAQAANLLFIGGIGLWLLGPLLMWYVKQVLYKDFHLKAKDSLHIIPSLFYTAFLIKTYYLLPVADQQAAMSEVALLRDPAMETMVYTSYLLLVVYGCTCIYIMHSYRHQLYERVANIEAASQSWLLWIIGGFILIALWKLFVQLSGEFMDLAIADRFGIVSTYFTFVLAFSLVVLSERYGKLFSGLYHYSQPPTKQDTGFKDEQIQRVIEAMEVDKLYLDESISVEKVAKKTSLPERTLSKILNQHFNNNFFEFINSYRVEEAKQILADQTKQHLTIFDVLVESGFTSKSSFHATFKRLTGETPSEYRKKSASELQHK